MRCLVGLIFCLFFGGTVCADSLISNAKSIAAYGSSGAYMLSSLNEMFQWNSTQSKWILVGNIAGNTLRQLDCQNDGTNLVGTDDVNAARKWNELSGLSASFSIEQSGTSFDWVILDPITDATKGKLLGLPGWRTWNAPSLGGGDPWYEYLPAGPDGTAKMTRQYFVDKTTEGIHRWEREDTSYQVSLNMSGTTTPFNVYYFGPSESTALDRITDPPTATLNIDDVNVKQISYDEDNQNLWSIDENNKPWRWDNTVGQWILSDVRGEGQFDGPIADDTYADVAALLRVQKNFYVRTKYVDGSFRPLLIIFKDTLMMQLVLGLLSIASTDDPEMIILDDPSAPHTPGGHILLQPRIRPIQYIQRGTHAIAREHGDLENLLVRYNIVASSDDVNVYAGRQFIMRR
jgi:hypothetical protein